MKSFLVALTVILVLSATVLRAEKQQPLLISVYITTAAPTVSPEGFVEGSDKVLADSARDIRKALDGKEFHPKKGYPGSRAMYRFVDSQEKADVTLIVASRGQGMESLGQRTTMHIYSGVVVADTAPVKGVIRWVSMIISVGTYKKEVLASWVNQSSLSAGAWGQDAKLLAVQAASWVAANESRILELRNLPK